MNTSPERYTSRSSLPSIHSLSQEAAQSPAEQGGDDVTDQAAVGALANCSDWEVLRSEH